MSGASSEKRHWKSIGNIWSKGGVKSKTIRPAPTGALLVAIPKRQYELFIVVVKLSVVERWARQQLKVHIKAYLIHALPFKIKVMCEVKVRSKVTMKRFHILGSRVDYMSCKELTLTQSTGWMSTKDTACVWRAYLKRSRSRSGHKRSL